MIRPDDIEFSYLTTALGYANIARWLGLEDGKDTVAANLDTDNLKRVFGWMFAKDPQGRTVLGESRNLFELAEIVGSKDALPALIETNDLATSYLHTEGPQKALLNAFGEALGKLRLGWDLLLKARPITTQHEMQAEEIFDQAKRIRNTVREELEDE